jgi:tryptophanyl-tRNA synthetase
MSKKQINDTIMKHAFSGGRETKELHQKLGGDISIDVCYQYLCYFLDSDQELQKIARDYSNGDMLTGQLKQFTANIIADVIINHQEAKAKVTPDILEYFFDRSKFKKELPQSTHTPIPSTYTGYDNYGINFDLTFGCKPKGAQ